jgi:hypothetical protein
MGIVAPEAWGDPGHPRKGPTALRRALQVCWLRLVKQAPRPSVLTLSSSKNRIEDYSCIETHAKLWSGSLALPLSMAKLAVRLRSVGIPPEVARSGTFTATTRRRPPRCPSVPRRAASGASSGRSQSWQSTRPPWAPADHSCVAEALACHPASALRKAIARAGGCLTASSACIPRIRDRRRRLQDVPAATDAGPSACLLVTCCCSMSHGGHGGMAAASLQDRED